MAKKLIAAVLTFTMLVCNGVAVLANGDVSMAEGTHTGEQTPDSVDQALEEDTEPGSGPATDNGSKDDSDSGAADGLSEPETDVVLPEEKTADGQDDDSLYVLFGLEEEEEELTAELREAYAKVRENWANRLTGAALVDTTPGSDYMQGVANVTEIAQENWDQMNTDPGRALLWEDLYTPVPNSSGAPIEPGEADRALRLLTAAERSTVSKGGYIANTNYTNPMGTTYTRLRSMALAWASEGSELYHDPALLADTISALEWLDQNVYNAEIDPDSQLFGNWYHWSITVPQALLDMAVLLYDELDEEQLDRIYDAVNNICDENDVNGGFDSPYPFYIRHVNGYNRNTMDSSNLGLTSVVSLLKQAVGQRGRGIDLALQGFNDILVYAQNHGDSGVYPDGSLLMHGGLAYNGGYGVSLIRSCEMILTAVYGTDWVPSGDIAILFDTVEIGFLPLMTQGAMMDMTTGRGIARTGYGDIQTARGFVQPVVSLLQYAEGAQRATITSALKAIAIDGSAFYESQGADYFNGMSLPERLAIKNLMADGSVVARLETEYTKMFGAMDKAVVHRENFSLGISMFSSRIGSFEFGNGENLKGWNMSDGATYLYVGDKAQYADSYWPTVNAYRLAGTTSDGAEGATPSSWTTHKSTKHYAGGSVLDGYYASVGMELEIEDKDRVQNFTTANKSWFVFDDAVVAVGSDISYTNRDTVETIVENRKVNNSNALYVDGSVVVGSSGASDTIEGAEWAWLAGEGTTLPIGYYFPGGSNINVLRENATGSYRDINTGGSDTPISREYVSIAVDHTAQSKTAYGYVLLPGYDKSATEAYADASPIEILAAGEGVHAVRDSGSKVTGYNFFEATKQGVVAARTPASVTMRDNGDGTYTLAVADPTHRNSATRLTLCEYDWELLSSGSGVTATDDDGYLMLHFATKGSMGASFTATVRRGDANPGGGDPEDVPAPERENLFKNSDFSTTTTAYNGATNTVNWQGAWVDSLRPAEWNFQRYLAGNPADNNSNYSAELLFDEPEAGMRAVKLTTSNNKYSGQQMMFMQPGVPLKPSTNYEFSFRYKTENVVGASYPAQPVEVRIDGSSRKSLFDLDAAQTGWQEYSVAFTTDPNTTSATIGVILRGGTTGTIYLSDFSLLQEYVEVTGVELEHNHYEVVKGRTVAIQGNVLPDNAVQQGLRWSSADESIATVSASGVVTGITPGTTTITARSVENRNLQASCTVEVLGGLFGIQEGDQSLKIGDKRFLSYIDTDSDEPAVWSSSNNAIATIGSDGLLVAVAEGTATITLTNADGLRTDSIDVAVALNTIAPDFVTMEGRWLARILGDETLDGSDTDIAAYRASLSKNADEVWQSMNRSSARAFLWDDPKEGSGVANDRSAHYTTQFKNLRTLALAFATEGTNLYGRADVYHAIIDGLGFMTNDLGYGSGFPVGGNWWDYQIGCTQPFVDILMILKNYIETDDMENYVACVYRYAYDPTRQINVNGGSGNATTANLTDIGLVVLGEGILLEDAAMVALVVNSVEPHLAIKEFTKTNPYYGDGMYPDGSYIDHSFHAYTGSYGSEFIKGIGRIMNIVSGTSHDFDQSRLENFYSYVLDAFIPLMYNGKMMSMVNGRSVARVQTGGAEQSSGNAVMANLMALAKNAPDSFRLAVQNAVKYNVNASSHYYSHYANARDIEALSNYKEIMGNDAIEGTKPFSGVKVYGGMDRVVQSTGSYTAGLALNSARIAGFESINGENRKGWHTGSGMLYVYTPDLDQFGRAFWPTVDSCRLPGTTVDTSPLAGAAGSNNRTGQNWAGGATDGSVAAIGYAYNGSPTAQTLTAKKSYFFLDGAIVQLGTDITGSTSATVETTVDNRMLNEQGSNRVLVNGEEFDGKATTLSLKEGSWIHLQSDVPGADMAYYFPEAVTIEIDKQQRSGTYVDINSSLSDNTLYEQYYLRIGINHGTGTIANEGYSYITLPGMSAAEAADFAASNGIEVVQNDSDAQAIRDLDTGMLAINYWGTSSYKVEWIEVNASASVLASKNGEVLTLTIAEPKHNNAELTVKLDYAITEVLAKDDAITVLDDNSFTVNTSKAGGASFQISFTADVPLSGISLNRDSLSIEEGLTSELLLRTEPAEATVLPNAVWSSSKQAVATVADGIITAVAPGTTTIRVEMGTFSAECEVTVFATSLTGIRLTSLPTKLVYTIGEAFDDTGLEVTADYSNGSSKLVTGYSLSAFDSTAEGSQSITVTYGGMSATFTVTVQKAGAKVYDILSGSNASFTGSGNLVFTVDADFDRFEGVSVNGKTLVLGSDYTAGRGSTVITLLEGYLKNLANGTYTIEILFEDGVAAAGFTVDVKAPGGSGEGPGSGNQPGGGTGSDSTAIAPTGDGAGMAPYTCIAIVGFVLAAVLVSLRKRGSKRKG